MIFPLFLSIRAQPCQPLAVMLTSFFASSAARSKGGGEGEGDGDGDGEAEGLAGGCGVPACGGIQLDWAAVWLNARVAPPAISVERPPMPMASASRRFMRAP